MVEKIMYKFTQKSFVCTLSSCKAGSESKKKTQRQTGKNESCKVGFGVSKQYNSTYVLKQSLFYTKYFSGCIRGEIG